jgi:hypothetical protein
MGGENLSLYAPYHALFRHRSPLREDTTRIVPRNPRDSTLSAHPRPVLDPASIRPRPTADQQGRKADVAQGSESFRRLILYVTMVSRDGRPFPGHIATTTSTGVDKTSPQGTPGVLASSYPIKGQARALQGEREASQKPSTNKQRQKDNKP